MANKLWYTHINGAQQGPYIEAELGGLIARGEVGANTLVWSQPMAGWAKTSDAGLTAQAAAVPAAPAQATSRAACHRAARLHYLHRPHLAVSRPFAACRHLPVPDLPGAVGERRLLALVRASPGDAERQDGRLCRQAGRHLVHLHPARGLRLRRHGALGTAAPRLPGGILFYWLIMRWFWPNVT